MSRKHVPFSEDRIREIAAQYPTPFHLYDEGAIRTNARRLNAAFAWNGGFREHFAVKANPNPHLIKILAEEGFGADCSSMAELVLCERVGIKGEHIFFSSNDTPAVEFEKAIQLFIIERLLLGGTLNFDISSRTGFDNIEVDIGVGIFAVIQI